MIFISYSSRDRQQVLQLCDLLQHAGIDVWIDASGIEGATRWSKEIVEAINKCTTVVLLVSVASMQSKNVRKEITLAAEKDKEILPVLLDNVEISSDFEYHLAGLHRLRFEDSAAILRALGQQQGQIPATDPAPSDEKKIRLAVLPFDDLSPSQDNTWFAEGMMKELIDTLSALSELQLVPRSDVIYYKHHKLNPTDLARDLGVRYLVEGAVQKSGDKIRIRVSLSDVMHHKQIWSAKYDGTFDDVFDLQEKTATQITEALRLKLTPDEERRLRKKETISPEAFELHSKAIAYFTRSTREDYDHAINLLKDAIAADPHYANAYSTLALICMEYYRTYDRSEAWIERAKHYVDQAAAIDGESARVTRTRSRIALQLNDTKEALRLAQRAVELDPNMPLAYNSLAFAYRAMGMLKETADANEQDAIRNPSSRVANFSYLVSLVELNDMPRLQAAAAKALPLFERHVRFTPDDLHGRIQLANIYAMLGQYERAFEEATIVEQQPNVDPHTLYDLACLYAKTGDAQAALKTLRKSVDLGLRDIETLVNDPDFETIRDTAEFKEIVQSLQNSVRRQ